MKTNTLNATVETTINASTEKVWDALINPEQIKKYMFGSTVISDWKKGSKIIWKGEWKGKQYEDKGEILSIEPNKELSYTHYSPLTGQPDTPESYHTVTIRLKSSGNQTQLTLSQDNNSTEEEKQNSEKNWKMMLDEMKKVTEENS